MRDQNIENNLSFLRHVGAALLGVLFILATAVFFSSCKKATECKTCVLLVQNVNTGEYLQTTETENICGTDKEREQKIKAKETRTTKLSCK